MASRQWNWLPQAEKTEKKYENTNKPLESGLLVEKKYNQTGQSDVGGAH